jgi:flagellin
MSRINTNVQSLLAQRVLGQNQKGLQQSLERLSTGLRITRGKDDPAGLIASENLRSELKSINAAVGNAERADQVVNIAEGGLQEVSSLLTELQGLITNTANRAGLSASEKEANQLQIDSILQTIDRISAATSFQGTKLLNGNFDYKVETIADGITDYKINGAKFNTSALDVNVLVTQSAQQAGLFLSMGATSLNLNNTNGSFTLEISGALGSRQLTFSSGTTMANLAAAIDSYKEITGVTATASSTGVKLESSEWGGSQYVSVKVVNDGGVTGSNVGVYSLESDDFNTADAASEVAFTDNEATNGIRDQGQNIGATINGIAATANGKTARINTDFLDVSLTLDDATATTLGSVGATKAFSITGGGADFQLAGQVDIAGKVSLGIGDVATRKLGDAATGYLSSISNGQANNLVDTNGSQAQEIVAKAIDEIASMRGRLGAFQKNTIGATIRSLGVAAENTAAAESIIRDADFATETAFMTRNQILVAASTNVLALANQTPQAVLQLLG